MWAPASTVAMAPGPRLLRDRHDLARGQTGGRRRLRLAEPFERERPLSLRGYGRLGGVELARQRVQRGRQVSRDLGLDPIAEVGAVVDRPCPEEHDRRGVGPGRRDELDGIQAHPDDQVGGGQDVGLDGGARRHAGGAGRDR